MAAVSDKIESALSQQLRLGETVTFVLKTTWKPSATIPILWLAVTDRRCILFSSLRRSHLFREATFGEINSVAKNGTRLRILLDSDEGDWELPIDTAYQPLIDAAIEKINALR